MRPKTAEQFQAEREWLYRFASLSMYLRGRGWQQPIQLSGRVVTVHGVPFPVKAPANDGFGKGLA